MKCRRCGEPILIDGKSLAPQPGSVSPGEKPAQPSRAGGEARPSPGGERLRAERPVRPPRAEASSPARSAPAAPAPPAPPSTATASSAAQLEPAPSRPKNEPPLRFQPVRAARNWDPDSSDFNDETVTLGREEAAALSRHALLEAGLLDADLAGDRVTPVSSPVSDEVFDRTYVEDAMAAFEKRLISAAPPGTPGSPSARGAALQSRGFARPEAPPAGRQPVEHSPAPRPPSSSLEQPDPSRPEDRERTQTYTPQPGGSDEDEATRMFEPSAETAARDEVRDDEATRVADAEVSQPSHTPPLPGGNPPRPALRPAQAHVDHSLDLKEMGGVPPLASLGPPPAFESHARPLRHAGRGSWGLYLFFASTTLLVVLTAIFFLRREVFELGVHHIREALGVQTAPPVALGPAFDTQAAGAALAKIADRVEKCREPDGPTGAGRVRVLFQTNGQAASAAVSKPFYETPVGTCLVELFKTATVPAFGGQPVIVTKSFQLP